MLLLPAETYQVYILFEESLVVTHGHLCFDFTDGFQYNTDNDDDGGTTECESSEVAAADDVDDQRKNSDYAEAESTDEGDTVEDLGDVIRGRTTGTDTGDGTAVRLEVVGNFDRIEGNRNIEVRESDEEYEGEDHIEDAVTFEQTKESCPEGAFLGSYKHSDRGRNGHDGVCEDDRHNTGHVDLDREVGGLAAVHLSADDSLCVLNRDAAFGVGHPNDEAYHSNCDRESEYSDDNACPNRNVRGGTVKLGVKTLAGNVVDKSARHAGESGYDVRKEDHGDTVADTVFVDLFCEPHNESGTCAVTGYDNETCEEAVFDEETVVRWQRSADRGKPFF